MNWTGRSLTRRILGHAQHSLCEHHLPRIARCLRMLSDAEVWWRPHRNSNSVANLVLHLNGNLRQWIISGLGGAPDRRERHKEFAERGPTVRRDLIALLRATVKEACAVITRLTPSELSRKYCIQGFRVTGLQALLHVTEHFAQHTGQIIFLTKLKRRKALGFTCLLGEKPKRGNIRNLPAI